MRRAVALSVSLLVALLVAGFSAQPAARLSVEPTLAGRTIRVMTYNIHVGIGMDKKLDLARIAEVINRQRPHLVGLQEVDRGVERTQRIDEIAELSKFTGMDYAYAFNLRYQGGQYGVAILSRFPILASDHRLYQNRREAERRGFIRVEVQIGERVVHFVTTHLDYQFDDGRLFEAEQLLPAIKDVKGPLIVVGDFNDEPTGQTYKLMRQSFMDAWMTDLDGSWLQAGSREPRIGKGLTYPADQPVKRIDYIFTRMADQIRTKRAWVVSTLASDHLPVVADLEITSQNRLR